MSHADEVAALFDHFGAEELHPDLEAYYEDTNPPCIRHPLVYSMFHAPMLNKSCNERLRQKCEALAEAHEAGNWLGYVFLHERPYRLAALLAIADDMDDEAWWTMVACVWTDSENIRQCQDDWDSVLRSDRPGRERMMDDEDREALADMADEIGVYQGCTTDRDDGWSWTIDQDRAEWFARRFALLEGSTPFMRHGRVNKSDVLAYLTNRNEDEIIVAPEHVEVIETGVLT